MATRRGARRPVSDLAVLVAKHFSVMLPFIIRTACPALGVASLNPTACVNGFYSAFHIDRPSQRNESS